MLISYKRKFIFIHVYKVAGTSIRKTLNVYADRPREILLHQFLIRLGIKYTLHCDNIKVFPPHATANFVKKGLPPEVYNNFYKFAFVRNPWDWQVSLYHFVLQDLTHIQHDVIKQMRSFDEYMESKQGF